MRVRKKEWARPELEASSFVIINPEQCKGKWNEEFGNSNPIHLELGCGTGRFICQNAASNPEINYIGIDVKDKYWCMQKELLRELCLLQIVILQTLGLFPCKLHL
jgi:tRNA G46 methylase TrmB